MLNLPSLSDAAKLRFANSLLGALEARPLGAPSKSEFDGFIYDALLAANYISDTASLFAVAERLRVSPVRVNGLRYASRLRQGDGAQRMAALAGAVEVVLASTKGDEIVLNVEDRFWRDLLEAKLKQEQVFVDYSFNRERLILRSADATSALLRLFGPDGARLEDELQQARARDQAQRFGDVFGSIAKKAAGAAAGAAAGKATAWGAVTLSTVLQGHTS